MRLLLLCLLLFTACADDVPSPDEAARPETPAVNEDSLAIVAASDGGTVALSDEVQQRLIAEDSLWARVLRVHFDALVVDGHVDTPMWMLDEGYDLAARHTPTRFYGQVDLPQMAEGGLDAAFFSIFVSQSYRETPGGTARARALIDEVKAQVAANADAIGMAYTADDVRRLTRQGKRAALLGLEGGHALQASEQVLRELYDAGIRYVTLTHVNTNSWADASQDLPQHNGLTDTGRDLVHAMNRMGMLVDVSHVSDSTFYDVMAIAEAPAIASHSSARAVTDNVRNLSDDQLRAVAANGGVVMVNFFDHVVNGALTDEVMAEVYAKIEREGRGLKALWNVIDEVKAARGLSGGSLSDIADHIDHIVRVAGVEHVGLGSDFDGVTALPDGLGSAARLPWLTYELMRRGYSDADVYRILGGNTLRVLEAAEQAATVAATPEATSSADSATSR